MHSHNCSQMLFSLMSMYLPFSSCFVLERSEKMGCGLRVVGLIQRYFAILYRFMSSKITYYTTKDLMLNLNWQFGRYDTLWIRKQHLNMFKNWLKQWGLLLLLPTGETAIYVVVFVTLSIFHCSRKKMGFVFLVKGLI